MARSKLVRRFKKRRARSSGGGGGSPRSNPPLFTDLAEFIGPGFGGFAATRFATRVAAVQVAKKWPKVGRHAGALTSVGAFFAAWFLAHRIKWLARFHTPIVVGAGIAALQSLIQLYIPKLGWTVSDAAPELAAATQPANDQVAQAPTGDDDYEVVNENHWYDYNDAMDAGRYANAPKPRPQQQQQAAAQEVSEDDAVFDLLEDDADDLQWAGAEN